ncbi:cupin domain-containing protein, partial [Flavobacteriaceae bacterium]|nr:cupin domain-containing protein [Flavobacteriaceae bacterium]
SQTDQEVHLLLFEKLDTKHTGNVVHEKTQSSYPKI